MIKKTIKDINIAGKRVLLRVDYNVSMKGKKISDDTRVRQTLPTLKYLLAKHCTVIIISHLDDPKGKYDPKLSLAPVAKDLEKMLGEKVHFETDYITPEGRKKLEKYGSGQIVLLENVRFNSGEETNDADLGKKLASLGQIFVNDGFGVSHRSHASVVGVAKYLPGVAGLLMEKEIEVIGKAMERPHKPFVAIVGGAKTETKINLLGKLMEKADTILLGGCIGNTFLKAKGYDMGQSRVDENALGKARHLLSQAKAKHVDFILPKDAVLGEAKSGLFKGTAPIDKIDHNAQALDIGPQTEATFGEIIATAKTIIWNGPMGMIEKEEFARGTDFVFFSVSQNTQAVSIVGGGDTIAALGKQEYLKGITHLSTGGGAMLEFIEKGTLPGIEVLADK